MWRHTSVILLVFSALALGSCSCGPSCSEYPNYYAKEAYRAQQAARADCEDLDRFDDMERSALVLNLESEQRSDWQRQAYETMEDWLARIEQLLLAQHAKIQALREQVQDADQDESNVVERIQRYRKLNEGLQGLVLRSRAQQEQQSLGEEQEPVKEKRAPFTVHMIKRGDTLYSLAKHYYGDAQKVHDIMLWNQGWVRYPEQIKAGQALILYPPGARDTREVVVERYLEEFLKQHSATL